jgi:hypothetical protein
MLLNCDAFNGSRNRLTIAGETGAFSATALFPLQRGSGEAAQKFTRANSFRRLAPPLRNFFVAKFAAAVRPLRAPSVSPCETNGFAIGCLSL